MKKQVVILFLGTIIALESCKKSKETTAVSELEGNWWLSKVYVDTAGNGNINSAKLTNYANSPGNTYQFNSNGGYYYADYGLGPSGTFYWSLTDNNAYLKITDSTYQHGTSIVYPVLQLTSTSLELIDSVVISQQIYPAWVFYTKK